MDSADPLSVAAFADGCFCLLSPHGLHGDEEDVASVLADDCRSAELVSAPVGVEVVDAAEVRLLSAPEFPSEEPHVCCGPGHRDGEVHAGCLAVGGDRDAAAGDVVVVAVSRSPDA